MRFSIVAAAALLMAGAAVSPAQERRPDHPGPDSTLPRAAAREVARLYAEPHGLRGHGRTEIRAADVVEGHASVIDGPLLVAGRVNGRVLAINADVILQAGARIDGDLLIVGGDVEGLATAVVTGEIRVYREPLRFSREGERLIIEEVAREGDDDSWWRRWERRRESPGRSRLVIASAGTYNRVEGLPVHVGPSLRMVRGSTRLRADAFAVFRTGSSFRSDSNDVGHHLALEARHGSTTGLRAGIQGFNRVAAVESWQLSALEYGMSAFLFRRDYLDLYGRHGGEGYLGVFDDRIGDATISYSHERWSPRSSENPWSLFRRGAGWRENPALDRGRFHVLTGRARIDTRNDNERPWAGWYVQADVEQGAGDIDVAGVSSPETRGSAAGRANYTRGFLDARSYNRVGPAAQLNFRLVAGGWLGGDPLPLQRRLSVSGPGALPGFDFRTPIEAGADPGTCAVGGAVPGRPALCDRIALAQVEYRGDLRFDVLGGADWRRDDMYFRNDAMWVVFADAGRGWLVGDGADRRMHYGPGDFPALSTFRTDMGIGLDFGTFGVFAVKAISDGDEPVNFLFRLRHRF
ncbi:MAG: hypothetical protein H0X64_10880 [Gemmatimonadaceae bacterium]|nr:hypothetical protein [Gemmatimonadaceae bacterium]